MFEGCDPDLVEHVIALTGAFDTATAFAMSFGINKFQLAQLEVKLVGELVGREGRKPNPGLVLAIHNWPEVVTLKGFAILVRYDELRATARRTGVR